MALIECSECGKLISNTAAICPNCGKSVSSSVGAKSVTCPKCGSKDIRVELFQEEKASKTASGHWNMFVGGAYGKDKGHGLLWWITIGWLWMLLRLCFAFPRIFGLFKMTGIDFGRKGSRTKNKIRYKTICVCENCAYKGKRSKFIEKMSIDEVVKEVQKTMKPE